MQPYSMYSFWFVTRGAEWRGVLCRCTTCKLEPYCSAMCAQAHLFDHECDEAPKPWLSPPVGPRVKPPAELGEEGFMGFIPWSNGQVRSVHRAHVVIDLGLAPL